MRPKQVRIQADTGEPFSEQPRVLPGGQATIALASASEQIFSRLFAGRLQIIVHGSARCLSQLELDWSARLLLANARTICCIAAWRDVIDLQRHDVAATKLAVDGYVEQGQVTESASHLELRPDGPDVLGAEGRLRSDDFSLVPRDVL